MFYVACVRMNMCNKPKEVIYRYAGGDQMEAWLHELLCLDAAEHLPGPPAQLPHPSQCDLYYVERDTLFSYHKVSLPPAVLFEYLHDDSHATKQLLLQTSLHTSHWSLQMDNLQLSAREDCSQENWSNSPIQYEHWVRVPFQLQPLLQSDDCF